MNNNLLKMLKRSVLITVLGSFSTYGMLSEGENERTADPSSLPLLKKDCPPELPMKEEVALPQSKRRIYQRFEKPLPVLPAADQTIWDLSNQKLECGHLLRLRGDFKEYPLITTLNLSNNNINDKMLGGICTAISNHPSLKELNLSHNQITNQGLYDILYSTRDNHLIKVINISYNNIKKPDFFSDLLDNPYLEELDVSYNLLSTWHWRMEKLAENKTLKKLIINNQAGYEALDKKIKKEAEVKIEKYNPQVKITY